MSDFKSIWKFKEELLSIITNEQNKASTKKGKFYSLWNKYEDLMMNTTAEKLSNEEKMIALNVFQKGRIDYVTENYNYSFFYIKDVISVDSENGYFLVSLKSGKELTFNKKRFSYFRYVFFNH